MVCVRFSPGGKYLAVGVKNGRTYIYDVKTGNGQLLLFWFGERQLTFVTVSSQITTKQENKALGVSVSPRMVDT